MIDMSFDEFEEYQESNAGFCIACQAETDGVEGDARQYKCDSCGQNAVYGIDELLLMGYIAFTG
jgi:hypothetical protein